MFAQKNFKSEGKLYKTGQAYKGKDGEQLEKDGLIAKEKLSTVAAKAKKAAKPKVGSKKREKPAK